jgi:hypothetical protein
MKYVKRIALGLFILLILATGSVFVLITFYKKEMAALLIDSLKTNYGLSLKVEDADVSFLSNWPQASVELKNIYLASDLYPDKNQPVLKAASISLSFNLEKLLHQQFIVRSVSIKDAEILLVKDSSGLRNFEFKKPATTAPADPGVSAIRFEVEKVSIKNTQFNFFNRQKKQHVGIRLFDNTLRFDQAQDGFKAALRGNVMIDELLFNESKGPFLKATKAKTDLNLSVYFKSKMIVVHPGSEITIHKHLYRANAFINLKDTSWMMLRLESEGLQYAEVKQLLTPKIQAPLENFTVEKPFDAKLMVITKLNIKEDPILILDIDVNDNAIQIGNSKVPYSGLSFQAKLVSLDSSRKKGNIDEATVNFKNIKGRIYDYLFTANVKLHNLVSPDINVNARLFIDAQKIKYKVAQDFILKGSCVATIRYAGPTNKLNSKEFLSPAMHLDASLFFNDFSYREKDKIFVYIVKGTAYVNNRDLKFDNLLLKTDAGEAVLKGKAENFVNYVLGYSNSLKADLVARSDYFNLNPYLPQKTGKEQKPEEDKKTNAEYKQSVQANESDFEFNASLYAKKLYIRKVEAENASIVLSHKNRLLNIKSINATTCGGKIAAKGTVYDLSKIDAEMEMQDIDINQLFTQFENFGQKKVESRHLQGRISLKANFKTELDDNMEVIGATMAGDVKLKLKEGHLQNFEPVQSMSNFVFRNRDFNDVSFSELNETFRIKGYEMEIQELEIGSNILNMYVTGTYNFKENSNINILLPWHNLRRRGKNYVPKNFGEGIENAKGLKLNFSGPTNSMTLSFGHKEMRKG